MTVEAVIFHQMWSWFCSTKETEKTKSGE